MKTLFQWLGVFTASVLFTLPQATHAGHAQKKVQIRYQMTGVYDGKDWFTGDTYFKFTGNVYVSPVDESTGTVLKVLGPKLGRIDGWRLRFHLAGSWWSPANDNLDTFISCANNCRIVFDDGAVLELLKDNPSTFLVPETNVPLQARLLLELGEVPTTDTEYDSRLRTKGCMGYKETAGRGYLAGTKGGMCLNGLFGFPFKPTRNADLRNMPRIFGETNATIVMH